MSALGLSGQIVPGQNPALSAVTPIADKRSVVELSALCQKRTSLRQEQCP